MALYEWEREVTDRDGDREVFGLRGDLVFVDCEQENGLLVFTVEGFGGFIGAAVAAFTEASVRAAARRVEAEAEAAGAGEVG